MGIEQSPTVHPPFYLQPFIPSNAVSSVAAPLLIVTTVGQAPQMQALRTLATVPGWSRDIVSLYYSSSLGEQNHDYQELPPLSNGLC